MRIRLCFYFFVIACIACNKSNAPDCFQQAGENKMEWRSLGDYQRIDLRDNIHLILVQSADEKIAVEGPTNLLPEIKTEIDHDVLVITNENTCNFVRSYKHQYTVTIYSNKITEIQNNGTGDITSMNALQGSHFFLENKRSMGSINLQLQVDSLVVLNTAGYSDIALRGAVVYEQLFHQGVGIFDASALHAEYAFVNNNSINDLHVNFSSYLFAALNGPGNIYYQGALPLIDYEQTGSGVLLAE
jgi:Putative auto-transporter adhesin, head GIN domain